MPVGAERSLALGHRSIEVALGWLEMIDAELGAFVDEADRRGRLGSTEVPAGPLQGVPVGVKDLYRVAGLPTRAGSRLPPELFDGAESLVVTRLTRAGAVVLGKTAMDELAYCEPPATKNPLDPRRTPGGSSGGSAAAVAAGICPVSIGSQTLESVLVPATYCGVIGFKPTFGRLPFDGVPLAPSIDTIGFLSRSIDDLRAASAAILPEWIEPEAPTRPVLGVPHAWGPQREVGDAWRAFEEHVETLRARGFELRRADVPWTDDDDRLVWEQRTLDLLHGEMAAVHATWFDRYADLYRTGTANGVLQGRSIEPPRVDRCREARGTLADLLVANAASAGIDAWICPTAPGVAPVGAQQAGFSWMTGLWSFAGVPSISIPVTDRSEVLPRGIQLVGSPGDDEELLSWAAPIADALSRSEEPA